MNNNPIIIIGAGPAGLMAAQQLATAGFKVEVYEQNKAAARKFLVAGHGGFNLTHQEHIATFVQKYNREIIQKIVRNFDNQATIQWLSDIGVSTYVGSSGKIFPTRDIKPIQVLQAWLRRLQELGVSIHYNHCFQDFDTEQVIFEHNGELFTKKYKQLILAMGGGSWKKTGSNAQWITGLKNKGIAIAPLASANSGYNSLENFSNLAGQVLKNIEVSFHGQRQLGEMVFTTYGIEGSPIYALNRYSRSQPFPHTLYIDLKPTLAETDLIRLLGLEKNISNTLKNKLKISPTAIQLLKTLDKATYTNPQLLAQKIKSFPIAVTSLRPLDEVISTAGGVSCEELDEQLMLMKYKDVYCVGEMIDWEAPTGGYLLQACFSTGFHVAQAIIAESFSTTRK